MPTFTNSTTGRIGTIQTWTVPTTAPYKIECWGAEGGTSTGYAILGGKGAYRYGEMSLTAGQVLKIVVGQQGSAAQYEGGGGGGSFVWIDSNDDLLCAAGGGGGCAGWASSAGMDAVITTSGTLNRGGTGTAGTNGGGGSGGQAASGAGWLANGGTASWGTPPYAGSAIKDGLSYTQGQAQGGDAYTTNNGRADGGFGGGGGSHSSGIGGGGGGGYSGGVGGTSTGGGGGGSFVHASMTNTGGTAATRTGHGQIIITMLNAPPTISITAPTAGQTIDPRLPLRVTWNYSDTEGSPQTKYEIGYLRGTPVDTTLAVTTTAAYSGAIQTWTVPETKTYRITAQGGSGGYNAVLPRPGYGAITAANFRLTAGHVIKILVGASGGTYYTGSVAGMGGGGGSFVYNETTGQLLLAAGGGGGPGGQTGDAYRGCDASTASTASNSNGTYSNGFAAATAGNGGNDGYYAGAGAGWLSNGQGTNSSQGYRMLDASNPGRGGFGYSLDSTNYTGGFGGGGGGSNTGDTGGGGGGYTGGNGGSTTDYPGGGGGSYVNSWNNYSIGLASAVGDGSVSITAAFSTREMTTSSAYHDFVANTLPGETSLRIRVRANDGTSWSAYATVDVTSDPWTYGSEVASAIQTGVDLPELTAGSYEAQVRTSDAYVAGPWSSTASFTVNPTSGTKIREAGAWRTVPLFVRVNGQWVALKKRRMP